MRQLFLIVEKDTEARFLHGNVNLAMFIICLSARNGFSEFTNDRMSDPGSGSSSLLLTSCHRCLCEPIIWISVLVVLGDRNFLE